MDILTLAAVTYAKIAEATGCDIVADKKSEVKDFYKVEKKASKILAKLLLSDIDRYYSEDLCIDKDTIIKETSITYLQYTIYESSGFLDEWHGYDLSGPTRYWLSDKNEDVTDEIREMADDIAKEALEACGLALKDSSTGESGFFGSYMINSLTYVVIGRETDGKRLTFTDVGRDPEETVREAMRLVKKWKDRPFLFKTEDEAKAALDLNVDHCKYTTNKPVTNAQVCYITL